MLGQGLVELANDHALLPVMVDSTDVVLQRVLPARLLDGGLQIMLESRVGHRGVGGERARGWVRLAARCELLQWCGRLTTGVSIAQ